MNYSQALDLVRKKVPQENLIRHMIAVSSIMKALAVRFHEPQEKWACAGLVHDIDLGETDDPAQHGKLGAAWLETLGFEKDICQAVKAHANHIPCASLMDKALYAADQISGLIVACALVKDRKLENVSTKTVLKRFKEKRFAAGANRESILTCQSFGLTLEDFTDIALNAMREVSKEIGL
ncbi:HDIG domain-containing protein [bacterium]|nr:HDIG domain-containing protein [candidate division CSSED10-310 bacterium]